MSEIFFSYSRSDSEFVDKLIGDLESRGIDVWVDRGDIHAGESTWRQQIVEAIKSCAVFFIVLSPNSFGSQNVNRELTLAERHGKTIIPIFHRCGEIPDSMAYQLAGLQELDFSSGDYDENFQQLLNSLVRLGFGVHEPEMAAANRVDSQPIHPPKKKSQNPLQKIPVWGWAVGGVVLLLILFLAFKGLSGGLQAEPTATIPVAVVIPTDTEVPATATDVPTNTVPPPTATVEATETSTEVPPTATETPLPTETPSPTPYPTLTQDAMGVEMVLVPAGEFIMGSSSDEANAFPAHTETTEAFYIDKFEVTNASYEKCVTDGDCTLPRSSGSQTRPNYYGNGDFNNYPVIWVTWDQAVAYCNWRGGRLPTEMEWEKAARGDDGRLYPWGDELGTECVEANYWETTGCGDTRGAGTTLGVSPYGAYEMAGNVSEWVQDDYLVYPGGKPSSISNSEIGNKVLRGGSWLQSDKYIKTISRYSAPASKDSNDIGFRCVVDIP